MKISTVGKLKLKQFIYSIMYIMYPSIRWED